MSIYHKLVGRPHRPDGSPLVLSGRAQPSRQLSSDSDLPPDRELALIDQIRAEVGAALSHLGLRDHAIRNFSDPIDDWGVVEHVAEVSTLDLIDALGRQACGCTPFMVASLATAALTAWRAVAFAAANVRHGGTWAEATDRAEQATRLCRWIYDGTASHTLGQPQ